MCKAMLSFVEKVSFIVPADGAINQIRNFLFGIAGLKKELFDFGIFTRKDGNKNFHKRFFQVFSFVFDYLISRVNKLSLIHI